MRVAAGGCLNVEHAFFTPTHSVQISSTTRRVKSTRGVPRRRSSADRDIHHDPFLKKIFPLYLCPAGSMYMCLSDKHLAVFYR